MKIIGIIAEYNPFHNGHAYQIQAIRRQTGADYIVIAMSGDFVQRGAPALIDKYARAQMALSCGADLVIELPVLWSSASAEYFAMAGVALFEKMGCVDGICFGAETDDLPLLRSFADILVEEPASYRASLCAYVKTGLAFPAARRKALCDYLTHHAGTDYTVRASAAAAKALDTPNNILAVEYLKALKQRHSPITPYLIRRAGAGYHDARIDACTCDFMPGDIAAPTASATAIRSLLLSGTDYLSDGSGAPSTSMPADTLSRSGAADALNSSMPADARRILVNYLDTYPALCADDFSKILGYQLLTLSPEALAAAGDCNRSIANRLHKNRFLFSSFDGFCAKGKSKDITYTRLSRILLHIILGISGKDYRQGIALDYIPYLRILGFRKAAAPLLTQLKEDASVPVLSKLADAPALLSKDAAGVLAKDIFAGELYRQVRAARSVRLPLCQAPDCVREFVGGSEFSQPIVRI